MFSRWFVTTNHTVDFLPVFSLDIPIGTRLCGHGGGGIVVHFQGVHSGGRGPIRIGKLVCGSMMWWVVGGTPVGTDVGIHTSHAMHGMGIGLGCQWGQARINRRNWHHVGVPPHWGWVGHQSHGSGGWRIVENFGDFWHKQSGAPDMRYLFGKSGTELLQVKICNNKSAKFTCWSTLTDLSTSSSYAWISARSGIYLLQATLPPKGARLHLGSTTRAAELGDAGRAQPTVAPKETGQRAAMPQWSLEELPKASRRRRAHHRYWRMTYNGPPESKEPLGFSHVWDDTLIILLASTYRESTTTGYNLQHLCRVCVKKNSTWGNSNSNL